MSNLRLSRRTQNVQWLEAKFRGVFFTSIDVNRVSFGVRERSSRSTTDVSYERCDRRRTFCDVRKFVGDRSSAATKDDLHLDRRRSRNVHRPSASTDGRGIVEEQRLGVDDGCFLWRSPVSELMLLVTFAYQQISIARSLLESSQTRTRHWAKLILPNVK